MTNSCPCLWILAGVLGIVEGLGAGELVEKKEAPQERPARALKDGEFLKEAATHAALDCELARLAEAGAGSAEMQILGSQLRTNHARSLAAARELARQRGVTLDSEAIAAPKIGLITRMRGSDFDEAYRTVVVKSCEETIPLYANAARFSQDLEIRTFAERTLGEMKELLAAIGGDPVKPEGGIASNLPKPARSDTVPPKAKVVNRTKPAPLDPAIAWAYRQQLPPIAAGPALRARPVDPRTLWRAPAPVVTEPGFQRRSPPPVIRETPNLRQYYGWNR